MSTSLWTNPGDAANYAQELRASIKSCTSDILVEIARAWAQDAIDQRKSAQERSLAQVAYTLAETELVARHVWERLS